jgi:hypothetical protein
MKNGGFWVQILWILGRLFSLEFWILSPCGRWAFLGFGTIKPCKKPTPKTPHNLHGFCRSFAFHLQGVLHKEVNTNKGYTPLFCIVFARDFATLRAFFAFCIP